MLDHQPDHALDREPPATAGGALETEHEHDPGAAARSRALVENEAATPVSLSVAARQFAQAAKAAVSDPTARPALVTALRAVGATLVATSRDPDSKPIGEQLVAAAAALEAVVDQPVEKIADAIIDPILRACDHIPNLERNAPLLHDGVLNDALSPLRAGIDTLRVFAESKSPPRYQTDVGALMRAADRLAVRVRDLDVAGKLIDGTKQLFDHFDAVYLALEQAEAEIPAARDLESAMLAIEAAVESGRKPNAYATAAKPKLDAFIAGLDEILARGPYGSQRGSFAVSSPLGRVIRTFETIGTVAGGALRSEEAAYLSRKDAPEDAAATADLIARHAPPPPDTREPAPAWVHPLEAAAKAWLATMRQASHPQTSRPDPRVIEATTQALKDQLVAVATRFPSAQQLAWGVSNLAGVLHLRGDQLETAMSRDVTEAEVARKAFWAEANAFALAQSGGPDFEQNLTLQWLTAIDREIADGIGWGYQHTKAGELAAGTHKRAEDRSVDEWNTPEAPEIPPVTLSMVARQLEAAARTIGDPATTPALIAALRAAAPVLASTANDPARKALAPLCTRMAAALEGVQAGPDDLVTKLADAIVDDALRAYEQIGMLEQLAPHLHDDEVDRALGPFNNAFNFLRNFGTDKATPRFSTDIGALRGACNRLETKVTRADLDGKLLYGTTELFDVFDGVYRALEQAEVEIPAARPLIDALLAIEAAIDSGRKPNAYATAAKPKLDAFIDGLDAILSRGPYGTVRLVTDIRSPLAHVVLGIEGVGTVVGGATRAEEQSYRSRPDKAEDPKATADLIARHQPPPPDTREPAPDWVHPLEAAAKDWLAMMRQSVHPRMSRPNDRVVEERSQALQAQLEGLVARFPSAQKLGRSVRHVAENLRFEGAQLEMGMAPAVAEAEAARRAFWAEANAFALAASGGADFEQNLTLQWLTAVDHEIADAIGWGYRRTQAGEAAGAKHKTDVDRTIEEWNTDEGPEIPPIALEPAAKQLATAARDIGNPEAMPVLVAALRAASTALAATARDPSRKALAVSCTNMAAALERTKGADADDLRAKLADAIVDDALRAYEEMTNLDTLAPHLDDGDLDRSLSPLRAAFNDLRNFGTEHMPPRFTTDVGALRTAANKLFTKVQPAALSGALEYAYADLFEPFDGLYRALEQAEHEIPQARPLIEAMQALEAAIASGRKPRVYASAAEAPLKAFTDGLHDVLARGPYGSNRIGYEISSPLTRSLGFIAEVGTVLGGVSRGHALEYELRPDKAEDPKETAALIERHQPPPPDLRKPAPDWCPPLESVATKWSYAMKTSAKTGRRVELESKALRDQLVALAAVLPSAQQLGYRLGDFEMIGLPNWQLGIAGDVADAEAARKAWWAEANAFALTQGPADRTQNLTLDWLMAIDRSIAEGLGFGYQMTDAGKHAAATHKKQVDRTIDELNTPDEPPGTL